MKKKNTKKLVIVSALVSAVVAAGVVAPTLAWLSNHSETVTNTFKSESITVSIDEAKVDENTGKAVEPEVRVTKNDYKIVAGRVLDKDPTPTVKKGSVDSVVYVKVTNGDKDLFTPDYDTKNWTLVSGDESSAIYRYNNVVESYDAKEDVTLKPIFETVEVSGDFTGFAEGVSDVKITVEAYAVQAEGLVNGENFDAANKQAEAYFNPTA